MLAPMSGNPFAPPAADLDVPVERGPVPRRVNIAVWLIVAEFSLGLLMNLVVWSGVVAIGPQAGGDPGQVLGGAATFLLFMAMAWKIHQGRNWARWIYAVVTGLGVVGLFISIAFAGTMLRLPALFWAGSVTQTALEVVAAVMLFTGDAARWFRGASPPG